jgi:hypothetical protein
MRKHIARPLVGLVIAASPVHAASITLGCSGTKIEQTYDGGKETYHWEDTVSDLSIVVDLDQKAVSGLWEDWDDSKKATVYTPLPIIATDANSVRFEAEKKIAWNENRTSILGTIDRITGALWAHEQEISERYHTSHETSYVLRCRPMKPLF